MWQLLHTSKLQNKAFLCTLRHQCMASQRLCCHFYRLCTVLVTSNLRFYAELPSRHSKEHRKVARGILSPNRRPFADYAQTFVKCVYSVLAIGVTTAMFIQTAKRRIALPYQEGVIERLLNNARGPVAKMNGNVARLTARRSWEEDDADHAWKKCTGYASGRSER